MIKKCFACGTQKDLDIEVRYPYELDSLDTEDSISPLLVIGVEGTIDGFRMILVCHECWHKLDTDGGLDIWISQRHYESLNPVIPFDKLPNPVPYQNGKSDTYNARNYNPIQ